MIGIDYKSNQPIYEQIIEQFKVNIMKGIFKAGDPVPSVRKMAAILNITPSTVAKAYAELERQGVIETIRAKGTFIAKNPETQVVVDMEKVRKKLLSEIVDMKSAGLSLEEIQKEIENLYKSI